MNTVIIIREECHGVIGVARDYESAIAFLVNECWLPCPVCDRHEEWKDIQEILGEDWVDRLLAWDIDNFNEFFEASFYLSEEEVYKAL